MTSVSRTRESTTEQLVAQLFGLIGRMTQLARSGDDAVALTTTQRLALMELSSSDTLRLHELAHRIGSSPPTTSRAVDGLVDADFIERVPDVTDRRAVQIRLSDHGREKIAAHLSRAAEPLDPAVAAMPRRDRQQLVSLLAELNIALRS